MDQSVTRKVWASQLARKKKLHDPFCWFQHSGDENHGRVANRWRVAIISGQHVAVVYDLVVSPGRRVIGEAMA